jgi:replication factor C subunit 1
VLGENVGPLKLNAIVKNGLKTLNEDQFLHLIATRKGTGKLDEKMLKTMEKEKDTGRIIQNSGPEHKEDIEKMVTKLTI